MKNEIKISHVHLETPLIISDEYVQLLIIENSTEFYNMVSDLDAQFDGKEGMFVFSANGEVVSAEKYGVMITDLFHFDLNDKKLLTLLYKRLEGVSLGEKFIDFSSLISVALHILICLVLTRGADSKQEARTSGVALICCFCLVDWLIACLKQLLHFKT